MKKFKLLTSSAIVMTMVVSSIVPAFAYSKEETVYAKMKTDGSQKEVVVSEHLNNDTKDETMSDVSTLKDIVNVNGNEKFTQDGNTITWQTTDGNDIYYQGNTEEKLPISMKISYKLNGKETKLKDMLGKKGDVEIKIDYINHEKRTVDGEELYVPFIITAGTMLSTKTDSNIEVTNGKVVSNGSNNIVAAIAAPGLSENYDNNEDLEKLNSITIKYTTTKFKLNSIMSVASPSLLSETDLDFSDLNSLYDNVDKLTSSYSQIVDGGKKLQTGARALTEKMSEVVSATSQLKDGSEQLVTGINQLVSGSDTLVEGIDKLDTGAKTLYGGIQTLAGKMQELTNGIGQVQGGIEILNALLDGKYVFTNPQTGDQMQLSGISNNIKTITNSLQKSKDLLESMQTLATTINKIDTPDLTNDDITNIIASIQLSNTLTDEQKQQYSQSIKELVTVSKTVDGIKSQMASSSGSDIEDPTQALTELTISEKVLKQLYTNLFTGVEGIKAGSEQLTAATKGDLSTGAQQLSSGMTQLKDKVPTLTKGINALNTGMSQLASGVGQLALGTEQLKLQGTDTLASGVDALVDGMVKFQDEGLNKISDVLTNTVKKDVNKTEKLVNLSKEYKTFTGVKDDVEATTKFIMIVDSKSK